MAAGSLHLQHSLAHQGLVHVATYNHGAQYVLTGGQDRVVRLWSASSGNLIKDYPGHGYEILGIAVFVQHSWEEANDNEKYSFTRFAICLG